MTLMEKENQEEASTRSLSLYLIKIVLVDPTFQHAYQDNNI
jgi:hypothetical protein